MPGDAEVFAQVTRGYPAGSMIWISGPGGDVAAALDIGDIIHKRYFYTFVGRPRCASACAVLFLSGYRAVIRRDAYLIFHSPYNPYDGMIAPDEKMDMIAKRVVAWGGVTYGQIWFLLHSAPPSGGMTSTEWIAKQLGFQFGYVPNYFNAFRNCPIKFCVAFQIR
jgi:hypothetical protein